ncbi:Uncharacterised protein [Mycobacterium tuberculosis]|nr:Uncharacterised protein [Mycobacterium tuberculosis]CNV88609.1 Uncharacterised protein [Mycobacterium tuberculosis]
MSKPARSRGLAIPAASRASKSKESYTCLSVPAGTPIRVGRRERCARADTRTAGRPPSRAGCEFRRVRRLADAGLVCRNRQRAQRHPHRRRPFRRQPPGQGTGPWTGCGAVRQLRAHQRPGSYRARQGAIHLVLHRIRRCDRRPDRLLRQRRRDLSGAQRRQYRRGGRRATSCRTGRSEHHQSASVLRGAGRTGAVFDRRAHRVGAANRDGLHGLRRRFVLGGAGACLSHRLHR